jgi:hypothetical protein
LKALDKACFYIRITFEIAVEAFVEVLRHQYCILVASIFENNNGLKTLIVDGLVSIDESMCTAMKDGLGLNKTLVSLELNKGHGSVPPSSQRA